MTGIHIVVDSPDHLIAQVIRGHIHFAIGFLPEHYAAKWVNSGELGAIHPLKINHKIAFDIIELKSQPETLVKSTFIQLLKAQITEVQPLLPA